MLFNDPDTLIVLISLFLAVAAVSVVFAVASLRVAVRDLRTGSRPRVALAGTIGTRGAAETVGHAA